MPASSSTEADVLLHLSEDPSIQRFEPHRNVPVGRAGTQPLVWAIDRTHSPLYWFPRDCPRVAVWARTPLEAERLRSRCSATALRLHAIEAGWLERVATTRIFAYAFARDGFRRWPGADGHWVSDTPREPLRVDAIDDLLEQHARAAIELRVLDDLWPMHDLVATSELPFSIVRMRCAEPRP